jgi:predicted DNA-binding protein (MmcQ/YjbR family)
MRLHQLRQFALALPHATVTKQWGETLVFKVGGKMFLIISIDGEIIEALSLKCSPEDFRRLTDYEGIVPAPYLARASWVQLEDTLALPAAELEEQVRRSYALIRSSLPKKLQASLAETESKR